MHWIWDNQFVEILITFIALNTDLPIVYQRAVSKICCLSILFGGKNLPQFDNSLGKLKRSTNKIAKNDQKCKQLIITSNDEAKRKVEIKPSLRDQIEANALFPRGELTSHDKQAHLCFYLL